MEKFQMPISPKTLSGDQFKQMIIYKQHVKIGTEVHTNYNSNNGLKNEISNEKVK